MHSLEEPPLGQQELGSQAHVHMDCTSSMFLNCGYVSGVAF